MAKSDYHILEGFVFVLLCLQESLLTVYPLVLFSTGVLSIPTAMYSLGALPGSLSIIGWGALNTYLAVVQGDFGAKHPGCHTIVDMFEVVGGTVAKEAVGIMFIVANILCVGAGILGVSIGLNALSDHAACTVWWSLIAAVFVTGTGSVRKFHQIGWFTGVGFVSIFVAVFIVVVAVTQLDRPAAAPQTGDFELGYYIIANPTFAAGIAASATIFVSSAGSSAFLPVISEMRNPKDYNKAVYITFAIVNAAYLAFSLVVYKYCGQWVASPSLGSAGPLIKKVTFGIGIFGLVISACIYVHLTAKYIFVRLLRNSVHLQKPTMIHWAVWLGSSIGIGALAFILAEAIPIFNYLVALNGSFCFAPLAIILPTILWFYDHWHYKAGTLVQKGIFVIHVLIILIGLFMTVGGTYGVILLIKEAYDNGTIGKF